VQTCPKQTCDNYFIHSNLNNLCSEDACVEGVLQLQYIISTSSHDKFYLE
jgi:hypothetical protein